MSDNSEQGAQSSASSTPNRSNNRGRGGRGGSWAQRWSQSSNSPASPSAQDSPSSSSNESSRGGQRGGKRGGGGGRRGGPRAQPSTSSAPHRDSEVGVNVTPAVSLPDSAVVAAYDAMASAESNSVNAARAPNISNNQRGGGGQRGSQRGGRGAPAARGSRTPQPQRTRGPKGSETPQPKAHVDNTPQKGSGAAPRPQPQSAPSKSQQPRRGGASVQSSPSSASKSAGKQRRRRAVFSEHLSEAEADALVQRGEAYVVQLRVNAFNRREAYATLPATAAHVSEYDVLIEGRDQNRAYDGDLVYITLYPRDKWAPLKDKEASATATDAESAAESEAESEAEEVGEDEEAVRPVKLDLNANVDADKPTPTSAPAGVLRPRGRVVAFSGTPSHLSRTFVGFMRPSGAGDRPGDADKAATFVPQDKRAPKMLVSTRELPRDWPTRYDDYSQTFYAVKLRRWDADMAQPWATVVAQNIGKARALLNRHPHALEAGDLRAESDAILAEFDVDASPIPNALTSHLKPEVTEEDKKVRRDLRHLAICSIDPKTARDIDDALHLVKLPNGNVEVGVHIADVSHYVHVDSPLDRLAQQRGTSTYLVQEVVPMLPGILSENLCSLNAHVDRYAFSVIWEMVPSDGRIVSTWFGKSIIASRAKLSYDDAQLAIDAVDAKSAAAALRPKTRDEADALTLANSIRALMEVARVVRKQRFTSGALALGRQRLHFELDAAQRPVSFASYAYRESNRLVEEFMLLANESVAVKIANAYPKHALLRRHAPPNPRKLDQLSAALQQIGVHDVDTRTAQGLHASLQRLSGAYPQLPCVRAVVEELATKPMSTAQYVCTNDCDGEALRHFALNVEHYTHFTSPIRRYADVLVHRLLAMAVDADAGRPVPSPPSSERMASLAQRCNERKMAARKAQDASLELYLALFIKDKPLLAVAIVTLIDVKGRQFHVYVPQIGVHERINIKADRARTVFAVNADDGRPEFKVWWTERVAIANSSSSSSSAQSGAKGNGSGNGRRGKKDKEGEVSSAVPEAAPHLVLRAFSLVRVRVEMAETRPLSVRIDVEPFAPQPTRDELKAFEGHEDEGEPLDQ